MNKKWIENNVLGPIVACAALWQIGQWLFYLVRFIYRLNVVVGLYEW